MTLGEDQVGAAGSRLLFPYIGYDLFVISQVVLARAARLFRHAERGRHRRRQQRGIAHVLERHEPGAVRERRTHLAGCLDRETRLARPAGTCQRHQPSVPRERAQLGERQLASG